MNLRNFNINLALSSISWMLLTQNSLAESICSMILVVGNFFSTSNTHRWKKYFGGFFSEGFCFISIYDYAPRIISTKTSQLAHVPRFKSVAFILFCEFQKVDWIQEHCAFVCWSMVSMCPAEWSQNTNRATELEKHFGNSSWKPLMMLP